MNYTNKNTAPKQNAFHRMSEEAQLFLGALYESDDRDKIAEILTANAEIAAEAAITGFTKRLGAAYMDIHREAASLKD